MSYHNRKVLFSQWESLRQRPLITYVTSIRPNLSVNMSGDSVSKIINVINTIPSDYKDVDFMIISNGGDPITSLRIVSILRERFQHLTVVVPYVAYSAATILALGADDILMHPFSNLGPVDPQLTILKSNIIGQNTDIRFSSEDIRNYFDFLKDDVGITDQQYLSSAIANLSAEVGAIPIGSAKRSQQLSLSLSKKMLATHIPNENAAIDIAQKLNSSFYHHGYAVSRKEAKEIGLPIIEPSAEEEKLMWDIWQDYSIEMKSDKEFNITNELMQDPQASQTLNTVPILNLPANTPTDLANQLIANAAAQISITTRSAIEFSVLLATIECKNTAYEIKNSFSVVFWRNADMTLGINATPFSDGWKEVIS